MSNNESLTDAGAFEVITGGADRRPAELEHLPTLGGHLRHRCTNVRALRELCRDSSGSGFVNTPLIGRF